MTKFLILTDSIGNPRSFPASESMQLEETFPYLIRGQFKDSIFWQLSFGNISTEQLINQAIGYLNHWDPDLIIVYSGINDCRPEAFTEFQKTVIHRFADPVTNRYTVRILNKLLKNMYHPGWIKRRQVYRVSKWRFGKTLKKFKLIFDQSKIFCLEICAGAGYEEARPGVTSRMEDYNRIIEELYGEDFVSIQKKMLEVEGFNVDSLHWNKRGHQAVADILLERINSHLSVGR